MSLNQPSPDSRCSESAWGFACVWSREGPGVTRVTPRGELDLATAPQLADALSQAARGSAAVIMDLSDLTFMDSSGLHAILTARARLHEANCRLMLVRGSQQVQRVFELTGTEPSLEFVSASDAVLSR